MGTPVNPAQLVQALLQMNRPPSQQPLEGGGMSPELQQLEQRRQQTQGTFDVQPSMTASGVAGPRPIAPATQGGATEWQTRSGKRMALTQQAIGNISQAVQIGAQQKWQKTAAGAEQLWQSYMALQTALDQATDPKQKAQIQKQIDAMMQDKNTMKILEKAHKDPTSPEAVGLQRGMQTSKQEAADQAKLEEAYAKIQQALATAHAEQTRGEANTALAGLYKKRTEIAGTLDPNVTAKVQGAKDIEAARAKVEADHWKTWADVERDKNKKWYDAMMARIKAMSDKKSNSELVKFFQTQMTGLEKQYTEVDKQMKDVQDNLQKTGVLADWFTTRGDNLRSQMPALRAKSAQLQAAMQDLNNKIATATAAGAIAPEEPPPAPPAGPPPGTPTSNVYDFTGGGGGSDADLPRPQ